MECISSVCNPEALNQSIASWLVGLLLMYVRHFSDCADVGVLVVITVIVNCMCKHAYI